MFEEIAAYQGYCDWLIAATNCPCHNQTPDAVGCLSLKLGCNIVVRQISEL